MLSETATVVLAKITANSLKQMLDSGQVSCVEIMKSVLEQVDCYESSIRAFLLVRDRKELLAEADSVDRRRVAGQPIGALAGLPVAIKDNICTRGIPTTCASRILANYVPPYDATVITRIRAADGIILGKTNLDEFAMGSTTENSAVQVTRNPRAPDRVPGGSSGGSAAAIAANEAILALGSDTGGSVRLPASFCGVVGLKPTYGLVSRYGLVAFASSFDQIGPLGKDVGDVALLLGVIAGHDPLDSTSLTDDSRPETEKTELKRPLRVGVPREYFGQGLSPDVEACVRRAIDLLRSQHCTVVPVVLPHTEFAIATYYVIVCCEASSNLARYDGCQFGFRAPGCTRLNEMVSQTRSLGFGAEVKRRIMLGTFALSAGYYDAYYKKAACVRALIARDFDAAFQECDVIAGPVAPTTAYRLGENLNDPLAMYLGDIYTVMANLGGFPAISLPCGQTKAGLPVGLQLMGPARSDRQLLRIASHVEQCLHASGDWRPK